VRATTITRATAELLERGLRTCPTVRDELAAIRELEERLADPDVALLLSPHGFLIAELNRSAFVGACVVIHFYAELAGELAELLRECMAFAHAGDVWRFQGVDINGLSESAYRRLLRGVRLRIVPVGMLYESAEAA